MSKSRAKRGKKRNKDRRAIHMMYDLLLRLFERFLYVIFSVIYILFLFLDKLLINFKISQERPLIIPSKFFLYKSILFIKTQMIQFPQLQVGSTRI